MPTISKYPNSQKMILFNLSINYFVQKAVIDQTVRDTDRILKEMERHRTGLSTQLFKLADKVERGFQRLNVGDDPTNRLIQHETKPIPTTYAERAGRSVHASGANCSPIKRGRSPSRVRNQGQGPSPRKRTPPREQGGSAQLTPCPFCSRTECTKPTRCALSFDWNTRMDVHERENLCPSFTCMKAHQSRCWKEKTVSCSYCSGRHHLAWCRDMALDLQIRVPDEAHGSRDGN